MVGAACTYARVPIGFDVAYLSHLSRNPYNKLSHFFKGLVSALVVREVLINTQFINGKKILALIVVCIAIAISASYELIEWFAAVLMGQGADAFLGTQGDPWGTQTDMLFALIGAIFWGVCFSKLQDHEIKQLHRLR